MWTFHWFPASGHDLHTTSKICYLFALVLVDSWARRERPSEPRRERWEQGEIWVGEDYYGSLVELSKTEGGSSGARDPLVKSFGLDL